MQLSMPFISDSIRKLMLSPKTNEEEKNRCLSHPNMMVVANFDSEQLNLFFLRSENLEAVGRRDPLLTQRGRARGALVRRAGHLTQRLGTLVDIPLDTTGFILAAKKQGQ